MSNVRTVVSQVVRDPDSGQRLARSSPVTARADWHVADPSVAFDDEPDPFSMPIEEVGERIDLRDPKAMLDMRLRELLNREANLATGGLTCSIKDRSDTTCHACPVSQAHDRESAMGVLCRLGREQEAVLTELAVLTCHQL